MEVPGEVKKNVRSVLLSKIGGVLVSEFGKDYKSLLQKPLHFKNWGFQSMTDFIKAMPDVVRLEFDDNAMAYKMFGIGDSKMYMSGSAKKAQRGFGGTADPANVLSGQKSPSSISNGHAEYEGKLNPNAKGLYSLCYPRAKEVKSFSEDDVMDKFSAFGDVDDVNMIPGLIFIRFRDRSSAIKCLNHYEVGLEMRIADERKTKNMSQRPKESGDAQDSLMQSRTKAPISSAYGDKIELYIGNINQHVTKEQFEDLMEPFGPLAVRMVKPKADPRKVFAFADFHVHQEDKAAEAIRELNQMDWEGRKLNVRFAQPDKPAFEKNSLNKQNNKAKSRGDNNEGWSKKQQRVAENEDEDEWGEEADSGAQTTTKLTNGEAQGSLASKMAALSVDTKKTSPSMPSQSPVISPQKLHPIISPIRSPEGPPSYGNMSKGSPKLKMQSPSQKVNKPKRPNFDELPSLEQISQDEGMPRLEQIGGKYSDMPSLEPISGGCTGMPDLEPIGGGHKGMPRLQQIGGGHQRRHMADVDRPVMLFIGNYVYYENEFDLADIFGAYGVQDVEIRNNNDRRKTTSAVVTVANMEMAQRAMMELDQTYHRGRRLLVCMAKEDPAYEPAAVFTTPDNLHNIRCTIGAQGASHRNVTMDPGSLFNMQKGRGRSFVRGGAQFRETSSSSSSSQDTKMSETTIIKKTFGSLLMTYKIIMGKLGTRRRDLAFNANDELTVYVTHVFDEQHFWGQVFSDESSLTNLNNIMEDLQCMETRIGGTKGLGRCAVQKDNEWFRGWITAERPSFKVDVFFVDYGNTDTIDKFKTSLTIPEVWEVKPMVRPFRITASIL
ncbi:Polyadenylate-binding protein, cytoplasmic and nuclear [Mizuhopecten yessoensis]|uniref:Polyadenylate-binding protein, cytoplasmic and nuclear n=1 Tax=Mizuhopecten yessoensis TaxID=6573 RepID=A0A210QZ16_MIZYE|nr:Polyadenylate-binding protein, cytoplasmic and nuclear [Mizuhopecten yessoensis]